MLWSGRRLDQITGLRDNDVRKDHGAGSCKDELAKLLTRQHRALRHQDAPGRPARTCLSCRGGMCY